MAGATNWLTFSLTHMEMQQFGPYDTTTHSHCFNDSNFYGNATSSKKKKKLLLNPWDTLLEPLSYLYFTSSNFIPHSQIQSLKFLANSELV